MITVSQASVLKLPAASVVTRVDESVVAHWSDVASLSAAQVIGASESSVKSTCFIVQIAFNADINSM